MAFLDGVKGKISKAGYSTMQKAKDLSEITKLNMRWKKSKRKLARSGSWKRLWKHANYRSRQSMQ